LQIQQNVLPQKTEKKGEPQDGVGVETKTPLYRVIYCLLKPSDFQTKPIGAIPPSLLHEVLGPAVAGIVQTPWKPVHGCCFHPAKLGSWFPNEGSESLMGP